MSQHPPRSATARSSALVIPLLALLLAGQAKAQIYSASITGVVTDPGGAAVPGAAVVVRNEDTNETRSAPTGPQGRFTVSRLGPGSYQVSVESDGFRRAVRSELPLSGGQAAEINFTLELGQVTETVEVTAAAVSIDTQSANQSITFSSKDVLDMPVNKRSPVTLVHNMAGVTEVSYGQESNQDQNHNRFGINGGRSMSSLIMIDGVVATAADWGGLFATPIVDSTEEVQVQRNSYDAEYGRTGGGVISIVTKGGGQQFHGGAWGFLRNDNLDANTWENNRNGQPRAEYKRSQFGGNISGPISKPHRVYFYGGYEGTRIPGVRTLNATLPTLLQRQGDFSQSFNRNGSLQLIHDPFSATPNADGTLIRNPFDNNIIPATQFDPVALNVLDRIPDPNVAGDPTTQARNFFGQAPRTSVEDRLDGRIDWVRTDKHSLYGRFTHVPRQDDSGGRVLGNGIDRVHDDKHPRDMISISNTIIPNPNWVISIIVGYGRWAREARPPGTLEGPDITGLGLPDALISQLQTLAFGRWDFAEYETIGQERIFNNAKDTRSLTVNATHEMNDHSIKFGFLLESAHHNFLDERSPQFSFNRGMTAGPTAVVSSGVSGNSIASFLLGTGSGGFTPLRVSPAVVQNYMAWYLQDSWRVNQRLTLNLGLRYEIQRPRTERFDRQNWFNFEADNPLGQRVGLPLRGGLVFTSADNPGVNEQDWNDVAPRFGFAYKLSDRLVMRGGYGMMFARTYNMTFPLGVDGFATDTSWVHSVGNDGLAPLNLLRNPYPGGLFEPTGKSAGLETLVGTSVNAWNRENPTPYIQNYSLDLQYQVNKNAMFELGYSGNLGRKLMYGASRDANQLAPQLLTLGSELNRQVENPFLGVIDNGPLSGATVPLHRLLRAHPHFSDVQLVGNDKGASSTYHSVFTRFNVRVGPSLSLNTSYQYSKTRDNASHNGGPEGGGTGLRNYFDPASDWSVSALDVPHSFVAQVAYQLPFGRGRSIGSSWSAPLDALLGGWQLSTVFRASSGLPVNMSARNTLGAYGFGAQRPNFTSPDDLKLDNPTPDNWFNTDAALQPGQFEIGTGPRWVDTVRQSGNNTIHLGLFKTFKFAERVNMQFRGEMYNLTNTPLFQAPNTTLASNTFGVVTRTFGTPRQIQLGLKLSF